MTNIIEALQATIPKAIDGFNTAVPAAFNEMQAGIMAVILNRVKSPGYPNTV